MKKNFTSKFRALFATFQIVKPNKSRQACLLNLILGIIKSRKVQFPAIAEAIKTEGDTEQVKSIIHRIEDFFREVLFDYAQVAALLISCLDRRNKIRLCIDRTEWDFGKCQVNILMITAGDGKMTIPLYWELLDNKSGNSNAKDRTDLMQHIITLIGVSRIGVIIGDREFIGHSWLKYLKDNKIHFCFRVPKSHFIEREIGVRESVSDLATEKVQCFRDCLVDGVIVNVWLKKLDGDEYLFLIGTTHGVEHLGEIYRRRWTIESMFQSFKQRGFDLESTHLKDLTKLKKLVGIVAIAYSVCISSGVYYDTKVQKIEVKKHGYKAKSFFRAGRDMLVDALKKPIEVWTRLAEQFITFLIAQHRRNTKQFQIAVTINNCKSSS
jgi:Transposase DDE domain